MHSFVLLFHPAKGTAFAAANQIPLLRERALARRWTVQTTYDLGI